MPSGESGSSKDGLSIIEKSSEAADEAFVMDWSCGKTSIVEVAPSVTLRTTVKTVPTLSISPLWNNRKPSQKASAVPDMTKNV